ncbi:GNAT family N-acetyltransferase [Ascidiimonas sp. W6]|uniref:GNAT family N-acetyltransferase n=1 Tax=Ascidiimonas meishanensis TaxID=3128903 RepID=UPI0030EF6396
MSLAYTIKFIPENQLPLVIPFWQQLDCSLSKEILTERLREMIQQGYQCVGMYEDEKLVGISGLWTLVKYYMGKHLELDNVIILSEYRDKGLGKLLSDWILEYAKSIGCNGSELNCYVSSFAAQKFWMNQGYNIVGYHFQKKISNEKN